MSREEAIDIILNDINTQTIREGIALNMAIKALEQESVLDKVRAEIEETYMNLTYEENHKVGGSWGLRKAMEIIDKYKAESENT